MTRFHHPLSPPEMKKAIRFRIGTTWLCVEERAGRAPGHPDHVTVALRTNRPDDRPGRRVAANRSTQRDEILALGLRLLELADRMPPESDQPSGCAAGSAGKSGMPLNFGPDERALIDRLAVDNPIDFARYVYDSAERLRARMPILRAAQSVLENCNDETAKGLHTILAATDMLGRLPLQPLLTLTGEIAPISCEMNAWTESAR